MSNFEFEPPYLGDVPIRDIFQLMLLCGMSDEESDKQFVKACRDELAKRKPQKETDRGTN